jgi:hypothetical protein
LYVVAGPWALAGIDRLAALKVVTGVMDVGIGFVLFFLARRFLNNSRAGLIAAVLYQLVPVNTYAFSAGNFSNLFGISTTLFFFGFLLWGLAGGGALAAPAVFLFSILALTSHFSTFLFDIVLLPMLWIALFWIATPRLSGWKTRLLWVAVASSLLLAAVYYAGYCDLFTSQWERVLSRDYATGATAVAGPLSKLQFNIGFYREQLGTVFVLLALLGALGIVRRIDASPFHASAAAWTTVVVIFILLDLTTALEVRYLLQVSPILSLFAATYLASTFERGRIGKIAVLAALAYLVAVGLSNIHYCLLYRYH